MKFRFSTYIIVIFSLCSLILRAMHPNVINFSPKTYNGANKNWSIGSDENGVIYVGNDKGLLEFDGINWTIDKLPSKGIVRSVGVANSHQVYCGGTEEFGIWEREISGKLKYHSLSSKVNLKEIQNSDFWRTLVTKEGVYFQSFSSIFFYDYKTVRKLKSIVTPVLLLNKVRDVLLYQRMKEGIYVLKGDKTVLFPGSEIFKDTDVRLILPYGKNGYLFATNSKGILVYEDGKFRELNANLSALLNKKDINNGVLTPRGTYLFGTLLDGVYEINAKGEVVNHLCSENVLQNKSVLAMWQDNGNNVWLGLDKGISYVSYNENLSYYTSAINNIGVIYAACYWGNNLLLGTSQGVISIPRSDLNGYISLSDLHYIPGTEGQVWNLKIIDGKLYCCHNNGLFTIGEDLSVHKSYDIGTGAYNIYKEQIGHESYFAVSTYLSLKFVDIQSNKVISPLGIDEPIYDVKTDHIGNLWLEHPNRGIYRCQWHPGDNSFSSIHYYGGTTHSLPYKLQLFKIGGRLSMIGDGKIYQYNDITDKIELNNTLNNLFKSTDPIKKVFPCNENLNLALTDNSFYLFSYDGYKGSILRSYSIGHNMNFVDNYETVISLNENTCLLVLDDGFIIYEVPNAATITQTKTLVANPIIAVVKSVNKDKETEYFAIDKKNIKVKNKYNTIEIDFTVKNSFSDNISSQYMLEGLDNGWSQKSYTNHVTYERLPPGNYTFKVRAVDVRGDFSEVTVLKFKVLPPWYNSIWAYLVYALLLGGIFYFARLYVLHRYNKQHIRRMRKLETMRLQMLADELQIQVNQKNAELVTQTSFIIHKNELIEKIRSLIEDFYSKNKSAVLQQLIYKINSLLSNNLDTEDDWKNFLIKFEEKHTDFFKKLKANYPSLTSTDLRLCACLKLNMETKDIASLMNLSVRAVENNRYRLRKKLELKTEQNLNEFFISID